MSALKHAIKNFTCCKFFSLFTRDFSYCRNALRQSFLDSSIDRSRYGNIMLVKVVIVKTIDNMLNLNMRCISNSSFSIRNLLITSKY